MSKVNRKVCVAPMMDCTDRHDRYFLRLISKNVMLYSEMISSGAILKGKQKNVLEFSEFEKPVALQLGGSSVKELSEASKIAEDYNYDEIHLNNGASIYDIVINGDLSSNGYKESFGIMVNYYYELEKIVKNHEDFVNKGKISIMNNLKEHV